MSRVRPCFLKMPARWPISDTDVSQLPRWPTASLTVSSADAALAKSKAAASTAAKAAFIVILPGIFSRSGDAFARRLAPAAKGTPVHGFGNYTFVGAYRRMRDARARRAESRAALFHRARGLHHQPPKGRDGHIARAEPFDRAIADRPHALPHRDVLVWNARD